MIIVHDIFVCKPGQASKMAKLFKDAMANDKAVVNIMTDVTGQYNRVIMVSQYENLAAYEKGYEAYMHPTAETKEAMAKLQNYTEMYQTGTREIYRTW